MTSEGDEDGLRWKVVMHLDQEVRQRPHQGGGIGAETRRTRRNLPSKAARDCSQQREQRGQRADGCVYESEFEQFGLLSKTEGPQTLKRGMIGCLGYSLKALWPLSGT